MDKNIKIALGCFGTAIFGSGMIVGMVLNEKLNQKYLQPSVDRYRELAENFKDLLCKEYDKNEVLKREVLRMKREEASEI